MICPENFLISWLYVFGNVIFTAAIGMLTVWMISKLIAFSIAERQKYQPNPYLVLIGTFLASEGVGSNLLQIGSDWWKGKNDAKVEELKTRIAELEKQLKEKDEPLRKLFKIITPILAKMIDTTIGTNLPDTTKMLENNLKPELIEKIVESGLIEKYAENFLSILSKHTEMPEFERKKARESTEIPESERKKATESTEMPNIIKNILTKIIDDSIGASNLKERIELKSKLMGIIEGFEHINKLIVSEPKAIKDILNRIKVNTLTTVLAEIKNDPTLKEKWAEFKLYPDNTFCIKDLPVGAIYNTVDTLKANLVK